MCKISLGIIICVKVVGYSNILIMFLKTNGINHLLSLEGHDVLYCALLKIQLIMRMVQQQLGVNIKKRNTPKRSSCKFSKMCNSTDIMYMQVNKTNKTKEKIHYWYKFLNLRI